jgi:hypothetical protein
MQACLSLVAPTLRIKRLGNEILERAVGLDRYELDPLAERACDPRAQHHGPIR